MLIHSYKVWNKFSALSVGLLLLFSVNLATAEVYKCANEKNKIVYSDTPCHPGSTQTVTEIQNSPALNQSDLQSSDKKQSSVMRQLDNAVKSAIAAEDLIRAEALAITVEQHEWVAEAKKEFARYMAAGRTEADLAAEKGSSDECLEAKHSLEKEAGSSFRKPDVLAAKTSLMRVSCGLKDDVEPIYADQTYSSPFLFNPYYSHRRPVHHRPDQQPGHQQRDYPQYGLSPMSRPSGTSGYINVRW
jgi:Domain of unknown function (DUF4124)